MNLNGGVTYWEEGEDKRIIYTVGPIVFAVNGEIGKLVNSPGVATPAVYAIEGRQYVVIEGLRD